MDSNTNESLFAEFMLYILLSLKSECHPLSYEQELPGKWKRGCTAWSKLDMSSIGPDNRLNLSLSRGQKMDEVTVELGSYAGIHPVI